MGWEIWIPIIAQYGIPLAEDLFKKWSDGTPVTAEAWADLRAKAQQTATDRLKAQLVAAGIPLDDPKAVALLNLTK